MEEAFSAPSKLAPIMDDIPSDLRAGQVRALKAGLVRRLGVHAQSAADLQKGSFQSAIEARAGQHNVSRDLRACQIDALETCLILGIGCHGQCAADPQQAGFQRVVESGTAEGDRPRDLRA